MKLKKLLGTLTLTLCLISMTSASYDKPTKPNELSTSIVTALDGLLDKIYSTKNNFSTNNDYISYLDTLNGKLITLRNTFNSTSLKYILVNYIISGVENIKKSTDDSDLVSVINTINSLNDTINKPGTTSSSNTTTSNNSGSSSNVTISNNSSSTSTQVSTKSNIVFPGDDGVVGTADDCGTINIGGVVWADCDLGKLYQWGRDKGFDKNIKVKTVNSVDLAFTGDLVDHTINPIHKIKIFSYPNIDDIFNFTDIMDSDKIVYASDLAGYYSKSIDRSSFASQLAYGVQQRREVSIEGFETFTKKYIENLEKEYVSNRWVGTDKQGPCPTGWRLPKSSDILSAYEGSGGLTEIYEGMKKNISYINLKYSNKYYGQNYSEKSDYLDEIAKANKDTINILNNNGFSKIFPLTKSSINYININENGEQKTPTINFLVDDSQFYNILSKSYNMPYINYSLNYIEATEGLLRNSVDIKAIFDGNNGQEHNLSSIPLKKTMQDLFTLNNIRCVKK